MACSTAMLLTLLTLNAANTASAAFLAHSKDPLDNYNKWRAALDLPALKRKSDHPQTASQASVKMLEKPLPKADVKIPDTSLMKGTAQTQKECGTTNALHLTIDPMFMTKEMEEYSLKGLTDKSGNPGAGMNPVAPFEVVLKDGFSRVECVKDHMYQHGDKFGPNRQSYEESSGVSIVHYNNYVAKEERENMTPKVCFDFCKAVPDMLFFGILNGNKCYCEPFYKKVASDSSTCDVTCPGSPTEFCGGQSKSEVFSMHSCED